MVRGTGSKKEERNCVPGAVSLHIKPLSVFRSTEYWASRCRCSVTPGDLKTARIPCVSEARSAGGLPVMERRKLVGGRPRLSRGGCDGSRAPIRLLSVIMSGTESGDTRAMSCLQYNRRIPRSK